MTDKKPDSLSIQFPPEATARIDSMAQYFKCEPHDVIARSLALIEVLYINNAEGNSLAILDKENNLIKKLSV